MSIGEWDKISDSYFSLECVRIIYTYRKTDIRKTLVFYFYSGMGSILLSDDTDQLVHAQYSLTTDSQRPLSDTSETSSSMASVKSEIDLLQKSPELSKNPLMNRNRK